MVAGEPVAIDPVINAHPSVQRFLAGSVICAFQFNMRETWLDAVAVIHAELLSVKCAANRVGQEYLLKGGPVVSRLWSLTRPS